MATDRCVEQGIGPCSVEDARSMVIAYARRWQEEMTVRFAKCELAMESPRIWRWDNRLSLLLMAFII